MVVGGQPLGSDPLYYTWVLGQKIYYTWVLGQKMILTGLLFLSSFSLLTSARHISAAAGPPVIIVGDLNGDPKGISDVRCVGLDSHAPFSTCKANFVDPELIAPSLLVTFAEQEQETPQRSIVANRDWAASDDARRQREQVGDQTVPGTSIDLSTRLLDTASTRVRGKLLSCPCASNDEKLVTTQLFCRLKGVASVKTVSGTTWSRSSTVLPFKKKKEVPVRPCLGVFPCEELAPESARILGIRGQSQAQLLRIRA